MDNNNNIITVARGDFEGRHYWINEAVVKACFKKQGTFVVRLPVPYDGRLIEVNMKTWKQAMKSRSPCPRRRLLTPNEFFAALTDDPTASSSLSSSTFVIESRDVPSAPPTTQWPLILCPESDIEKRVVADVTIEALQEGLLDYARLLADQRWERPIEWSSLIAAYPSMLGASPMLRFHTLIFTSRLILAPYPWLTRADKGTDKFTIGIDELYPPLIRQFFNAEEAIVAAQCSAEAVTAAGALACLRVAQQAYPRLLAPERLGETARSRFAPHMELRLLSGIGIVHDDVSAEELCRRLIPRLHIRALKDYVSKWIREFAATSSHVSSEEELLAGMHPEMAFAWRIAHGARSVISAALQCASPAEFFLKEDQRRRPSAVPNRVTAHLVASTRKGGMWQRPVVADRQQRLGALEIDMEDLFRAAPPCMARVLKKARTQHHLKNDDRYPLSTWLAAIFPRAGATDIARSLFGGMIMGTSDEANIITAIETAKRKAYAPVTCLTIIKRKPDSEVAIACPYKDRARQAWPLDAEGNPMRPVESACAACYAKEKGLPNASPPLLSPVDHVLFFNEQ